MTWTALQRPLVLPVLALLTLVACGPGSRPPAESNFEIGITGLKPIADEYVNGKAVYLEQNGVHYLTGTVIRNEGYDNESYVAFHLVIRGVLEERSYSATPDTELDDELSGEITVIDGGFTSFGGSLAGGNLGLTTVTSTRIEGGFILSFRDDRGALIQTVGSLRAVR